MTRRASLSDVVLTDSRRPNTSKSQQWLRRAGLKDNTEALITAEAAAAQEEEVVANTGSKL